jgi:hypothetical protein
MRRHPATLACAVLLMPTATLAEGISSGPWIQRITPDEAWVLWQGDEQAVVEWGSDPALGQESAASERSGEIHHARLPGLNADTRYHYRLRHGEGSTTTATFSTPSAGPEAGFTFVVMSDTQHDRGHPERLQETVEQGIIPWVQDQLDAEPDQALDLVLVVGDLVDDGWEEQQWQDEFIGQAQALMGSVPFYAAIGNHEANSSLYFDRFLLPENGSPSFPEHWWSLDRGNARIIGLNSNAPYTGETQQAWLVETLEDACGDDDIDFVFAAMHHPWHSELWPPGESDFAGEVIALLDAYATDCGKPAVHFFGHTHGYSRGQSRDAAHLQVNVATASGNIDYWGEYEQIDYEEFSISLDEYGFVVVELSAGDAPTMTLRRIGLGDEEEPDGGSERDRVVLLRHPSAPAIPEARSPASQVSPHCVQLASSPYCDPDDELQGASHWQLAASCDGFDSPLEDRWVQHENRYGDVDQQAGDHLGDTLLTALEPGRAYCWRVRHRDRGLAWSGWSEPTAFETGASSLSDNLLINPGAEQGTDGWEASGPLEALEAGECDGTEPHQGLAYLVVGGICEEGADYTEAQQLVDITAWAEAADSGELAALFGGHTASHAGSDLAEMELRYLDAEGAQLGSSGRLGRPEPSWTELQAIEAVPPGTRSIAFVLMGTRNAGQDCDAYFDALLLQLDDQGALAPCLQPPPYPYEGEQIGCEDTGPEPSDSDAGRPGAADGDTRCGCGGPGSVGGAWVGLLILGLRRRKR